jgi:hypothetical protein
MVATIGRRSVHSHSLPHTFQRCTQLWSTEELDHEREKHVYTMTTVKNSKISGRLLVLIIVVNFL